MPNKLARSIVSLLASGLVVAGVLTGCTEFQQVAEGVARQTGGERAAGLVRGGSSLASGLLPIGFEEEQSIGAALALQVLARYNGVYDQPELTRYVNLVGRAVALTSDRPNIEYHFAILNHDSINAFATPAGYVFITKGILRQIHNEAELAVVLGHEISHISEKHILEVMQRSKQLAGVSEAGLAAAGQNPAVFKGLMDQIGKKLLDEGLDQNKELDADRIGVIFAARVGYDPNASVVLLQRLRTLKGDDQAFFKTHPNFSSRIEEAQKGLRTLKQPLTGAILAQRFTQRLQGRL